MHTRTPQPKHTRRRPEQPQRLLLLLLLLVCCACAADQPDPSAPATTPPHTTEGSTTPVPAPATYAAATPPVSVPITTTRYIDRTTPITATPTRLPATTPDTPPATATPADQQRAFDTTPHTVRPPFLAVWEQAKASGHSFGPPHSAPIWLDGHLVQCFDSVLLETTTPVTSTSTSTTTPTTPMTTTTRVTVRTQPAGWRTQVPTDMLHLEASPYHASVTVAGTDTNTSTGTSTVPVVAPLLPLTLTLHIDQPYSGTAEVRLYDSRLRSSGVVTAPVVGGQARVVVQPRGWLGHQWALVLLDGRIAGARSDVFVLNAETEITTGQPDLDLITPMVRSFLAQDVVSYEIDGVPVRGYRSPDNPMLWLRDHVYQGRGFRYFERDVTSLLEAFRREQYPDGSFPDVLDYPPLHVEAHRMETESDLEYLFVQGVYEAWQMTGDDAWLREMLPAMYRGIDYITSDPQRWDENLGLVRRPYTIDTWDFQYGPATIGPQGNPSPRHWIDDQTVWGVFHGDNTGLAHALKLLERTEAYLGNTEASYQFRNRRNDLMERLHAFSWNGPYYTHFLLPDKSLPTVPGVDTGAQLSLSNAIALNRDVLEFEQCRAILETYHRRRDFDRAFAEWYSIDPPFPAGSFGMGGGKGEQPGEYVNGGIMPLVGGELARGAFTCGSEEYGFDILRRYAELLRLTGASYLWYYPDGRPGISGSHTLATDGWGSSAMLGALIEGAAGVNDKESRFRVLELSPRWAVVPGMQQARVVARYAASDGYVAYQWHYAPARQQLSLDLTGTWERAEVRLLLPPDGRDTISRTLLVNGQPAPFEKIKIGTGQYIVTVVRGGNATITLSWVTEEEPG